MPRMRKIVVLVLLAAGLLSVPAAGIAQTATTTPPTPTTPAPPLAPARDAAIYPVIDYGQVLDATKPLPAKLSRFTTACRKLGRTDVLIAAFRGVCRTEGDAYEAGLRVPNCRSAARCRARLTRYASDLGRQAAASRRLNGVLKTTITDADCRSALRINLATLHTIAKLRTAATKLVRTIATATSMDPVNKAVAAFYAIDRSPLLDHRGRLDTYRAACR
jgi:hypothetical protein